MSKKEPEKLSDALRSEANGEADGGHETPGTFVLALVFLVAFAVYYFANWKALADVWHVR